jgi:hypothetical protein
VHTSACICYSGHVPHGQLRRIAAAVLCREHVWLLTCLIVVKHVPLKYDSYHIICYVRSLSGTCYPTCCLHCPELCMPSCMLQSLSCGLQRASMIQHGACVCTSLTYTHSPARFPAFHFIWNMPYGIVLRLPRCLSMLKSYVHWACATFTSCPA